MADETTNATNNGTPTPPARSKSGAKAKVSAAAQTVSEEASKAKTNASTTLKESATRLQQQATGKARAYIVDGKDKAGGALDEFSRLMQDAAGSVDDSLGAQYGDYARSAAKAIGGFSDQLKAKNIDELLDDLRNFARKSPAVAVGTAAAIGFVLARLVKSGIDGDREA